MTKFALIRHAEADYTFPNEVKTRGWGFDLAPLTPKGENQAIEKGSDVIAFDPEIVIISPTTRTMHTALHLRPFLKDVAFKVEPYLHEWLPDNTYTWDNFDFVLKTLKELEDNNGEWPKGQTMGWESLSMMKERVLKVFDRYLEFQRVLVVCHGGVTWAVTGNKDVNNCDINIYEYSGNAN